MDERERSYPATIAAPVVHELEIRRSRFITRIEPALSVADAEAVIAAARTRHWDANHNCTAMVTGLLGDQARSSDDGEPGGTAGMPMLEVLRRRGLTDVVAVVTRYFGGVKLGAGGLIRAYSTAVSETLDTATLLRRRELLRMTVAVGHADAGRYDNVLRDWAERNGAVIGEPTYGAEVTLELWTPPATTARLQADLAAASAGAISATPGATRIIDTPH